MGIPGQTTSRPPPAIFKVDVSCGASSPSFLVPFAFLTAIISNLARCRRFPLFLSMFGHYYAVARACIGKPLSWPRYDRGLNTNYVPVRLFCGFARYRSYRNALLYSARIPSLLFLHLWFYQRSLLFRLYYILMTESILYKILWYQLEEG